MTTALEILKQLGGNKFLVMTGSKNLVSTGEGLRMTLTRNKIGAKYLDITLTSLDLYLMKFYSVDKDLNLKVKAEFDGIYNDMLQSIFTKVTGLNTSL